MFLFTARAYLEELERFAPEMLAECRAAVLAADHEADFMRLGRNFLDCPGASIDYAVMEKTRNAAVAPLDAGWSDVGSWSALHAVLEKHADGNVLRGDVISRESGTKVWRREGRRSAATLRPWKRGVPDRLLDRPH